MNWVTILGFLLLPIAFVPLVLAFVYWFFFLRNLHWAKAPEALDERNEDTPSN